MLFPIQEICSTVKHDQGTVKQAMFRMYEVKMCHEHKRNPSSMNEHCVERLNETRLCAPPHENPQQKTNTFILILI